MIDAIDSSLKWRLIEAPTSTGQLTERKSDNGAKKQASDMLVITFMVVTALISSEVQRKAERLCWRCRHQEQA